MLELPRLRSAPVRHAPFRWCHATDVFSSHAEAAALLDGLGWDALHGSAREQGGDKRYRVSVRQLVDGGRPVAGAFDAIPSGWEQLVREIDASEYRATVGGLLGVDLADAVLEARLCRYSEGCWMGPHTDRADKLVTQIVYLNSVWERSWGGCLRLLRSPRSGDVEEEILPLLGSSILFVRSDRSWHEVPPVRADVDVARFSLLVHFGRGDADGG